MASDDDYAAFLDRANEPTSTSTNSTTSQPKTSGFTSKTHDTSSPIPSALENIESVYISEADEEWVPVSLNLDHGVKELDVKTFAKVVGQPSEKVEEMQSKQFDPRGQYGDVMGAVEEVVGKKGLKVFRVELGGARCEYWVVGMLEGKRVVGAKVGAVES
jgi:hypothetical protein